MPEKLLTLKELSAYVGITEKKILELVDREIISAYHVGGEFLRFRKDQINAIREEIEAIVSEKDRITIDSARAKIREERRLAVGEVRNSLLDRILDFFHFYDFYIITSLVIAGLLYIIYS